MSVELPENLKKSANKCPHGFRCAETGKCGDEDLCKVEYSFGANVLQLTSRDQLSCPYRLSFGNVQLCTCPVRQYLHNTAV